MNPTVKVGVLEASLRAFAPDSNVQCRALAWYSAAIAVSDESLLTIAVDAARRAGLDRVLLYEIVLQSYLFLGFPRMLEAADHLHRVWPGESQRSQLDPVSPEEAADWFSRGNRLYGRVYADTAPLLRERTERLAPEIFRWMIIEGYGKVLSRPGLEAVDRELAIVASLVIDNRGRQLHSHLKGALNVGASADLIRTVIADLGEAAGEGYATAVRLLARLGIPG